MFINFDFESEYIIEKPKYGLETLYKLERKDYFDEIFYLSKINELIELQNKNIDKVIQLFDFKSLYGMDIEDIDCLINYYK